MGAILEQFSPESISELLKDLRKLEVKHRLKNSINIFEAADIGRQEIKHSRMLAFLLNPMNAHCLGGELFKNLCISRFQSISGAQQISAARLLLDQTSDLNVQCEWRNIDILVWSESLKVLVAIENKIDAKESFKHGKSQLNRYADILEEDAKFQSYSKLLLFLTVDGDDPADDRWEPYTYEQFLEILSDLLDEKIKTDSITDDARFLVTQYIEFLRRNVAMDPRFEEDCRQIYQKHKAILEKIFQVSGAGGQFSDLIQSFSDKTNSHVVRDRGDRFAYLPERLMSVLPSETLEIPWWGQSDKPILYWFIQEDKKIRHIVQVGPMTDKEKRRNLVASLDKIFGKQRSREMGNMYTVICNNSISYSADDEDLLSKMISLHERVEKHLDEIITLVSKPEFN